MLILTRRIGESIIIGEGDVELEILEIKGRQVRIGCKANENVSIHRNEIYQRMLNDRKEDAKKN